MISVRWDPDTNLNSLCKKNKDVEGRYGCMSDDECLDNARGKCDRDPNCFGISWYPKKRNQPLKICLSNELEPKDDGWRTIMKTMEEGIAFMKICTFWFRFGCF